MWPEWVKSIEDLPYELHLSIQQALRILDWQENLMEEEMPPEWMWVFEEDLEQWFADVKEKRNPSKDKEETGWVENDLYRNRRTR